MVLQLVANKFQQLVFPQQLHRVLRCWALAFVSPSVYFGPPLPMGFQNQLFELLGIFPILSVLLKSCDWKTDFIFARLWFVQSPQSILRQERMACTKLFEVPLRIGQGIVGAMNSYLSCGILNAAGVNMYWNCCKTCRQALILNASVGTLRRINTMLIIVSWQLAFQITAILPVFSVIRWQTCTQSWMRLLLSSQAFARSLSAS